MNLFRPQVPYVHHPPKYSPWFKPVLTLISRHYLKKKFKIASIKIRGVEKLARLVKARQSVLVAPNHADHADPSLMVTAARRNGFTFHFMAAREGFEKTALQRFFLQKSGAFSVNREGGDLGAFKTAIQILQQGEFPLVIFPEGEIYHHHELLDELNEGVANIMLRASAKLPKDKKSFVVPAAIRIRHADSIEGTFSERLDRLEQYITWKPRPEMDVVDRIYQFGSALLSIKEEEFLGHTRQGNLVDRIQHLQNSLLDNIEKLFDLAHEDTSIPARIKSLRAKIRGELTDLNSESTPQRQRELYDYLDRIFVAQQLYSYPGRYLKDNPTMDRIAETIFKLEEDVLKAENYYGPRIAEIIFDDPIEIQKFLEDGSYNSKTGVTPLTQAIRKRITALLSKTV